MNADRKIENRRSRRYEVQDIHGRILYVHNVEVLNISIDGMAIETKKRLDLNRIYTFKFYHENSVVDLQGKVIWAKLVSKEDDSKLIMPVYRVGIKFLDTYTQQAMIIAEFIEKNKIKTIEKRLGGIRFQIKKTDNIKIEYPENYVVKKLSLTGMLAETNVLFKENSYHELELEINGVTLNIKSRVAYLEKILNEKDPRFKIGFEFIEMSNEDRTFLENFIKNLEFQNY